MKTLKVKDYRSKDDVTWNQFKEFAEIGNTQEVDDAFLTNRLLKIFYDLKPSDAMKLQADQVDQLLSKVVIALNQPESKFKQTFNMNGVDYGFFDFSKMTYAELVDLDTLKDSNDWIAIASICYRPILKSNNKGEYFIEEYKGYLSYKDNFKDIPLSYIEGMQSLFMKSLNRLSQDIQNSTQSN